MDLREHPYTPGAGTRPAFLTGRDDQIAAFEALLARLEAGLSEQAPLITGLRGVGKTVLLNTYEDIAIEKGWKARLDEAGPDASLPKLLLPWVRDAFADLRPVKGALETLRSKFGRLEIFSVGVTTDGQLSFSLTRGQSAEEELTTDLTTILLELGRLAQQRGTGAVFLLDEVQFLKPEEFAPFIAALHRVMQKSLPVTFVGAGLPQLPRLAGEARSYAERLFDFSSIGKLDDADGAQAIIVPAKQRQVDWADDAVAKVLRLSEGYPFFIQQYAKYAWLAADESPIDMADVRAGEPLALRKLDQGFFQARIQRSNERERRYLAGMASLGLEGPYRSGEVVKALGGTTSQWSDVRDTLIKKGLVYSDGHGRVDYTVPQFAAFMRRQFPAPAPRRKRR